MSLLRLLITFGFAVLCACTRPVDSDFKGEIQGLADHEVLWVERIPANPDEALMQKLTRRDSARLLFFNEPLFEQVIPELVRMILDGEINAYEDYEFTEEEKLIPDLNERLTNLGASRKDYSPFAKVAELLCIFDSRLGRFQASPAYLRIIWRDPEGKKADQNFASIKVNEILNQDIGITIRRERISFIQYLVDQDFMFSPVYVRSNEREYSTLSPEEALYLKNKILRGEWNSIDWVDSGMNISGKEVISLPPDEVQVLEGVYLIQNEDSSKNFPESTELFLTAERDYLIADWSHRFRFEKIFSWNEDRFFSNNGELYFFDTDSLSTDSIPLRFISKGDTFRGIRIEKP